MKKLIYSLLLLWLAVGLACVMLPLGILWTVVGIGIRWWKNTPGCSDSGNTNPGVHRSATDKSLGYLNSIIRSIAVGIDQIGNSVCRDMLNRLLISSEGYQFGKVQETISSVLGKNERDGSLTPFGVIIVEVLDFLDKDHCEKSIQDFGLCNNQQPPCEHFTSLTKNEDG